MPILRAIVLFAGLFGGLAVAQYPDGPDRRAVPSRASGEPKSTARPRSRTTPDANLAPRIFWRKNRLPIPFNVDSTSDAREVQLYVSSNRGGVWQLYDRKAPAARRFLFRAARDGEYWFASRTVHGEESPSGEEPQTPELRVVIDTTKPHLKLSSLVEPSGEVRTTWETSDAHLNISTFVLQYQPLGGRVWLPVKLAEVTEAAKPANGSWNAQLAWWPTTKARSLVLRGAIDDEAGNQAVQTGRLFLPAVALRRPPRKAAPSDLPQDPFEKPTRSVPVSPTGGDRVAHRAAPHGQADNSTWDEGSSAGQFISTTAPRERSPTQSDRADFSPAATGLPVGRDSLNRQSDARFQPGDSAPSRRQPQTSRNHSWQPPTETTRDRENSGTTRWGNDQPKWKSGKPSPPERSLSSQRDWETAGTTSQDRDKQPSPSYGKPSPPERSLSGQRDWETAGTTPQDRDKQPSPSYGKPSPPERSLSGQRDRETAGATSQDRDKQPSPSYGKPSPPERSLSGQRDHAPGP